MRWSSMFIMLPPISLSRGAEVEARYLNVLRELKQHVTVPVTMKLSSQFSSVGAFCAQLARSRRGRCVVI